MTDLEEISGNHFQNATDFYRQEKKYKAKVILVMRYCNQGDMKNYMGTLKKKNTPNPLVLFKILQVFYGACLGVKTLHERGLIHVDIKPDNIFVDDDDVMDAASLPLGRLGDFEQCLHQDSLECEDKPNAGTPNYASPQLSNGESFDKSTDVRAFLRVCILTSRISCMVALCSLSLFSSNFLCSLKIYSLGVSFAAMYWNTEYGFCTLLSEEGNERAVQSLEANIPRFVQRKNLLKIISTMIQSDPTDRPTISQVVDQLGRIIKDSGESLTVVNIKIEKTKRRGSI